MASAAFDKTATGASNIIKLLPTGTVFMFQYFNPIFTSKGHCNPVNKYSSATLISLGALWCFLSSFTDTFTDSQGNTHYAIATSNGLWPSADPAKDLSSKKLTFKDFVHAFLSLFVFLVVVLLDSNTVNCFSVSFTSAEKFLLNVLPTAIGVISSVVFAIFPNSRQGLGYYSNAGKGKDSNLSIPLVPIDSSSQSSGNSSSSSPSRVIPIQSSSFKREGKLGGSCFPCLSKSSSSGKF